MTLPRPHSQAHRFRRARTGALSSALEVARALALMVSSKGPEALYDLLSTHNNLGRDTLYLNMGYWKEASSYDQACQALAELLACRAELGPGLRVVDAGFGFGDQDLLWAQRFGVDIVGFNVTASQVQVAHERVRRQGLEETIDLRCGSALNTGLADESVDRVLALESAFHFPSRDAFFAEAARVLAPGGRIALADLAFRRRRKHLVDRVGLHLARSFWQIPAENHYTAEVYAQKLEAAGFEDVRMENISDDVFVPFGRYARVRQAEADVAARANPLLRAVWRAPSATGVFDYMIFSAAKPGRPS